MHTTRGQCLRVFSASVLGGGRFSVPNSSHQLLQRWCDYCCHPFWGRPALLESPFHRRLRFCGRPCVLAYRVRVLKNSAPGGSFMPGVAMAPPKCCLSDFGGWMSVDEFRACTKFYEILPEKIIVPSEVSAAQLAVSRTAPTQKRSAPREIKYGEVPRNETVKIKKRKEIKKSTVMDRLGFNSLKP